MANKRISELDDLPTVTSDDLAVVVDISTLSTRKASMANLKNYFQQDIPVPTSEMVTVTGAHLLSKSLTLTKVPRIGYNVTIVPHGGCAQFSGSDFELLDSTITWNTLGLDGLLEVGDLLRIDYFY